ncbi:MAG: hypothetical protein R3D31_03590 [Hyphomicrobiaceae bacterium]
MRTTRTSRLCMLLLAVLLAAGSAAAKARELRIATWTMQSDAAAAAALKQRAARPVWRHTFGPRDTGKPKAPPPATLRDADIVALQGVSDLATIRRLFSARQFQIVLSRQVLAHASDETAPGGKLAIGPGGYTAIVVRRRRGLRVLRQEHLSELALPGGVAAQPAHSAGTAVKLSVDGRTVWLVSVVLAGPCPANADVRDSACVAAKAQADTLATWLSLRRRLGETALVAGTIVTPETLAATDGGLGPLWLHLDRDHDVKLPPPPPPMPPDDLLQPPDDPPQQPDAAAPLPAPTPPHTPAPKTATPRPSPPKPGPLDISGSLPRGAHVARFPATLTARVCGGAGTEPDTTADAKPAAPRMAGFLVANLLGAAGIALEEAPARQGTEPGVELPSCALMLRLRY